jgi:hypothetical protein
MDEPDGDNREGANILVLVAAILLVAFGAWLLIAFRHSSAALDCLAAHHRDCDS